MTLSISTFLQNISPFRNDTAPADLGSRLDAQAASRKAAAKQTKSTPARPEPRRCPAMSGKFIPLTFEQKIPSPCASPLASADEANMLEQANNLISKLESGIYYNFAEPHHRSGQGITEKQQLTSHEIHSFSNRKVNLDGPIEQILNNYIESEILLYATLACIEFKDPMKDPTLRILIESNTYPSFSLSDLKKSQPMIDFHLGKKLPPEKHKVLGFDYRFSPNFMKKNEGLRPDDKVNPTNVTNHLMTHGAVALMMITIRNILWPDLAEPANKCFAKEAATVQNEVWDAAYSGKVLNQNKKRWIPENVPNLSIEPILLHGAESKPALITIPSPDGKLMQPKAATYKHPENHSFLCAFPDYLGTILPDDDTQDSDKEPIRFCVSDTKPIASSKPQHLRVFKNLDDALECWNTPTKID